MLEQKVQKYLAKKYKTMDNLMNATFESLAMVEDVGEITAKVYMNFLKMNKQ